MSNIIMSRVFGRLKGEDLAIALRVLIDIGTGQFEGFEPPVTGEGRTRDERAIITALDIGAAERHKVFGQGLNGFTHYPQKREIVRYFPGDVSLPERIILLDGSGSISFDVLSWLAEQKVSFIRIDWKGDIVCVAGASGYSANPFRVRWQLETRENPPQRNDFCRSIITRKIEATIITLEKSIPRSDKWERAMKSAYAGLSRLEENPPENISELRALEANCAASYFRSWVGTPIKWRGTSRRPIPDNWHSIGVRSSPYHLAGYRSRVSGYRHGICEPVKQARPRMTAAQLLIEITGPGVKLVRCRFGAFALTQLAAHESQAAADRTDTSSRTRHYI
jgi:hypothetical protein